MQLNSPERVCLAGRKFDVLVIGGGINGIAIARECAHSGKRVVVVEQKDFGSGTTSRSTRIIHGGLRYLEHGEISLVRESLRERDRLLRRYPNLVRPMQFLLALKREPQSFLRSSMAIRTGLWLYHRWAGASRQTFPADANEFERLLDAGHSWAVYSYEDAQCEFPERLVAEWLAEALILGAAASNYTQVLKVVCRDARVVGAQLRDVISGKEFQVSADKIVNAAGPWADSVVQASGLKSERLLGGVRGSHIVLPMFSGGRAAAVNAQARDGRQIFVIPWNKQVLVGTTEVADSGDPARSQPAPEEIDYLFAGFLRLFPRSGVTRADIRYAFAGVRPLPYSPGRDLSSITRKHIIYDHQHDGAAGLISIIGGKLTTAMSLAREVARKLGIPAAEPANALAAPAPADEVDFTLKQWAHLVECRGRVSECAAQAIAAWHGSHALGISRAASLDEDLRAPLCSHSEHIVAEAVEAVAHESAVTLGDILLRRVPVALGPCWTESCSFEAASRIGRVLGWDRIATFRQFEQFEQERTEFLHPKLDSVAHPPSAVGS